MGQWDKGIMGHMNQGTMGQSETMGQWLKGTERQSDKRDNVFSV